MDLGGIRLSEIIQIEEHKYHVISVGSKKKKKTNRLKYREQPVPEGR